MKNFQVGCCGEKKSVEDYIKKFLLDNPNIIAGETSWLNDWCSLRVTSKEDISVDDLHRILDSGSPVERWDVQIACCPCS